MEDYLTQTSWVVIPDDPDIAPEEFCSKILAEDWAAGLCCSYDIQPIEY